MVRKLGAKQFAMIHNFTSYTGYDMKLKSIQIKDFKRFVDLEITNIPQTTKLVLLTGPNGSGKTSLFEAFNYWMARSAGRSWSYDEHYYKRPKDKSVQGLAQTSGDFNTWINIDPHFHGITEDIRNNRDACKKFFIFVRLIAFRQTSPLKV